jgi:hypothetical protein
LYYYANIWKTMPSRFVRPSMAFQETPEMQRDSKDKQYLLLNSSHCKPPTWYNFTGKPILIPGYPGSGSEMLREIIKAITGLGGDDFYHLKRCQVNCTAAATYKTHWPTLHALSRSQSDHPGKFTQEFASRYIILVRNPRDAIPSFYNYMWEVKHNVKSHSSQANELEWIDWRDRQFDFEISNWKSLFGLWKNESSKSSYYERGLVLPYEDLVDPDQGPQTVIELANELRRNGVRVASDEDIPCLWYHVVKKNHAKTKRPHRYLPSYTSNQKRNLLDMLEELKKDESGSKEFISVLKKYQRDIRESLRVLDWNQSTS